MRISPWEAVAVLRDSRREGHRTPRFLVRLAAVIAFAVACATAPQVVGAAPASAPAFALELFGGQTLRLADLKGKAVVLLFWAEW
jgi:hypothetical protein